MSQSSSPVARSGTVEATIGVSGVYSINLGVFVAHLLDAYKESAREGSQRPLRRNPAAGTQSFAQKPRSQDTRLSLLIDWSSYGFHLCVSVVFPSVQRPDSPV